MANEETKHAPISDERLKQLADMANRDQVDSRTALYGCADIYSALAELQERRAHSMPSAVTDAATHRHKKRGTEYVLIGIGKMQAGDWQRMVPNTQDGAPGYTMMAADMAEVAVYRSATDLTEIWVRPREEFEDGRFEALTHEAK